MAIGSRQRPSVPTAHRWTVDEYFRADEAGLFGSHRVELVEGELIDLPLQDDPHAWATSRLVGALVMLFPHPYWVKIRGTLRLNDYSAPEPDIAVMSGPPIPPADEAPVPLLIIEVSESSLQYDRVRKSSLYAMNGIADYWVADVAAKQVEVFRDPARDTSQPYGWGYKQITVFKLQDRIASLAKPSESIDVASFVG
jgi:Uma2 family endonuclease